MLQGKKILLGITGSIAAYKSAVLARLLVKEGAEVKVIMTPAAHDFITPLTLSTLSRNPVLTQFAAADSGQWNSHVELGMWADVFLIAPASANTMAKCARGMCDNLLTAVYLSARCPVIFAPAMDLDMYNHPSTGSNMTMLEGRGNYIIPAATGELASGLTGQGRMTEPEHVVSYVNQFLDRHNSLSGEKIMVTAGPTREPVDPVRFLGNQSSGKMGLAITRELSLRGAEVKLILGPVGQVPVIPNTEIFNVVTASEMYGVSRKIFHDCKAAIFSAAVADYRPENVLSQKLKRKEESIDLKLVKNPDIAGELGKIKTSEQVTAGFALESSNALEHAREKLKSKYFDFIVVNSLEDEGAGFGHDTNKISILDKSGDWKDFPVKSKREVAMDIVDHLAGLL
ncbi:MAG TPA: bifunctional phosphopantothenoylcysteine decarboxylase/phosphopantothenate--cysteine ligase CoaBC [Cyclobacteriaceae bacterium]|nr:bifunctional phosphopantothenoylcysteine decarboxylase/phosphopantothenate--cysteine ligase CoaBC [Cyclobacteriaceae bacterium]